MDGQQLDKSTRTKLEELKKHMLQASESLTPGLEDEEHEEIWSLEAALVRLQGERTLWAVAAHQDWEHDMLDGTETIAGTLYADDDPFNSSSSPLTGYFQAEESGKWLRIDNGKAVIDATCGHAEWRDDLADFPAVAGQMQAAMDISEYRHLIEKAVIQQFTGN